MGWKLPGGRCHKPQCENKHVMVILSVFLFCFVFFVRDFFVRSTELLNKSQDSWSGGSHCSLALKKHSRLLLKEEKLLVMICLILPQCKPFSGLHGPNVLRPRSVRPGRVPLLCRMGRVRMWEPQGLLHGPMLWTWCVPGRHRNLQLWSQLDRPRLLYRWELSG